MLLWGRDCPLPALAAFHRRGMVCSWLALLSPLFCAQAWRCLRLGLFACSYPTVWFAIPSEFPQIALRAFRASPYSKQCSLRLPAQPRLLVALLLRWGSYRWARNLWVLIIYLFFLPVMLPSVVLRLTTDSAVRVFPGV